MKLKYLLLAAAGGFLFASCESDDPSLVVAEYHQPTKFVLNTPQFANGLYDLLNAKYVNFTFSQPDYGYAAVCNYQVEVSSDADFTEPQTVSEVFHNCDIQVSANDYAMAVCAAFGWEEQADVDAALADTENGTIPVYTRIHASISTVEGSDIVSNAVVLNTVPYFALPEVKMPAGMWMVGNFNGWSFTADANMVPASPLDGDPFQFWCIQYVKAGAGEGFKFNTANSWNGDDFGPDKAEITSHVSGVTTGVDGTNYTLSEAGWYIFGVTVGIEGRNYTYKVDVFPPDIYIIGTCNGLGDGAWSANDDWKFTVPETADGDFVSPALAQAPADDGGLRICINPKLSDGGLWAGDWWRTEFIILNGKIAYRGAGGDQERVKAVNAGQKVYLNFAKGEGKIE